MPLDLEQASVVPLDKVIVALSVWVRGLVHPGGSPYALPPLSISSPKPHLLHAGPTHTYTYNLFILSSQHAVHLSKSEKPQTLRLPSLDTAWGPLLFPPICCPSLPTLFETYHHSSFLQRNIYSSCFLQISRLKSFTCLLSSVLRIAAIPRPQIYQWGWPSVSDTLHTRYVGRQEFGGVFWSLVR